MSFDYLKMKHEWGLTEEQRSKRNRSNRFAIVAVSLILLLGYLWSQGTFDHALLPVGLNAKPCARNGFGAVFCGQELTEYNKRLKNAGINP